MSKKRTALTIISVILVVYLIYRVFLSIFGISLTLFGEPKKTKYFDSPQNSIANQIEIIRSSAIIEDFEKGETVYSYENAEFYIEFYISKDKTNLWLFLLNKETQNGIDKYCVCDYRDCVYLKKEWTDIQNFRYCVVDDKDILENQASDNVIITEFQMEILNKTQTYWLLFSY